MALIQDKVQELISPVVEDLGFQVWGVEYVNGRTPILRVFIDKEDGITIDDCALVSHAVSAILDANDPIESEYNLEVSSPGLDRPLFSLAQFAKYVGDCCEITLRLPHQNRRKWFGKIVEVTSNSVKIDAAVTRASLNQKVKPGKAPKPTSETTSNVVELIFTNIAKAELAL